MLNFLIEKIISEVIFAESAIKIDQLQDNFGLYVRSVGGPNDNIFILYNIDEIKEIQKAKDYHEKNKFANEFQVSTDEMLKVVYGFIQTEAYGKQTKVNEVVVAAAQKGYGPLMYEVAMSYNPERFLMADRGSIKPGAIKVWEFFLNNRSEEFEIINAPLRRDQKSNIPALTKAFRILNPINTEILIDNSKRLNEKMSNIDSLIEQLGSDLFKHKYFQS